MKLIEDPEADKSIQDRLARAGRVQVHAKAPESSTVAGTSIDAQTTGSHTQSTASTTEPSAPTSSSPRTRLPSDRPAPMY